ncbi:uncharacterized protein ASCRUDRAFT_75574 [Ascoidea rubescens DSM 1968]|uniref:Uncharacterized protein n=1 Tax=Ascoidea rubescens DSM 1968 TaxID=1344418 RepID=A0A1D2VJ69_9ASCO|nr:hypothetical protein ASCRUDRAFT_75574 [Ascoidea rubescens DSM 1968]ODV61583.1 hypothetical protein ASCRUDRAFT_75574 [Ascoidea rubescens DSM 1968]
MLDFLDMGNLSSWDKVGVGLRIYLISTLRFDGMKLGRKQIERETKGGPTRD